METWTGGGYDLAIKKKYRACIRLRQTGLVNK